MKGKIKRVIYRLPIGILRNYVGTEIAIGFIERALTKADVNTVYHMIENNIYNIFELDNYRENPKAINLLNKAKRIIRENEDIIRKTVTYENVVNVLRAGRPDLLSLIVNHPRGMAWLKRAIDETLNFLLS